MTTVSEQDDSGVAIVRLPGELTAADRSDLRKTVYKLLAQSPAAIIIDLSTVTQLPSLIQMTLLAMAVEAAREPATPLLMCASVPEVARGLTLKGSLMRVYPGVEAARLDLATDPEKIEWIQRSLGSSKQAPVLAANHISRACSVWQLPWMRIPAGSVGFDLVDAARGPYELHLTVSLRPEGRMLVNVRNYVVAERSTREHGRMRLKPAVEAKILNDGAVACGQLVTTSGVAWWASLKCRPFGEA